MGARITNVLSDNILVVFFMAVYLAAWTANTTVGTHFVMADLQILAWLIGGMHVNNSLLNSPVPMIQQLRGPTGPQQQGGIQL